MGNQGECLVCGESIQYLEKEELMECIYCHQEFSSYAKCKDNHFVCDECHSEKGIKSILEYCMNSNSKNPIFILQEIMRLPYIYMHGPEHHVMVGAAMLTAFYNSGGEIDLQESLIEMESRGKEYPGGSCGLWGCCGAAVSVGMFLSIVTKATPLSTKSWKDVNKITATALNNIADIGGPRCCKRNSFTAVIAATKFVEENYNISLELPEEIICTFNANNEQCKRKSCPYFQH